MKSGNVLSEYGLLLGLLVVMLMGLLALLGKTNAQLLGSIGQNSGSIQLQNMIQMKFQPASPNADVSQQANPLAPTSYSAGIGVNTTSVDGQRKQITSETINYANELEALAKRLPPGSDVQTWLTVDVIPRVRTLAAVEGYASNISTLKDKISGSYSDATASSDLTELRNQLVRRTQQFTYMLPGDTVAHTVKPSPELTATIVGILNQAVAGTQTFGVTSQPAPSTGIIQIAKAYDPNTTATNLVNSPYSQSSGYLAIVQNIQQAQANNTINQNTETATSAGNADKMADTASKLP